MPLLSTRGAASALGYGIAASQGAAASFIASETGTGASSSFTSLGAQAGDLAVLYGSEGGSAPTSGGGAWSTASGGTLVPYYRVLTSGDIAASGGVTSSAPWGMTIYRGPKSLVWKTDGGSISGPDPQTITGFTPAATCSGLLTVARHYVPGSGGTPGLPLTPATWASRQTWSNNAGDADRRIADRLSPANSAYAGQAITWNAYFGSQPSEGDEIAVFELRNV